MEGPGLIVAPGLRPGRYLSLQERYEEWRATPDGHAVYLNVMHRATRLVARGWRHFGVRPLWEAARYDRALDVGPDAQGFKINDHYHSRMARELMDQAIVPEDFFETRELRA